MNKTIFQSLLFAVATMTGLQSRAAISPSGAALFLDFEADTEPIQYFHGVKSVAGPFGKALEFTTALQYAEAPPPVLDGISAMTVGGWFFPRRSGEQSFFFRGLPEIGPQGERFFRRNEHWVNFVLGTDQHGFLLGTINGNGSMPFPLVTVNDVPIDEWSQLVVVKDERGHHQFYRNGSLVYSDRDASNGGKAWPFRDSTAGEPVRLAMPMGGLIGEVWIFPKELSVEEIRADFLAKRGRYKPALPAAPIRLREMNTHPSPNAWQERSPSVSEKKASGSTGYQPVPSGNLPDGTGAASVASTDADFDVTRGAIDPATWPRIRQRLVEKAMEVLGPFPKEKVPLDPIIIAEQDCGTYLRRKISIQVQPGDRMPAYLLVPKQIRGRVPAIVCFYGTTSGAGKETTVGLSGRAPGTPPLRNSAFAIDMVEAGFVAFAADYLRDGERIKPGQRPYDTTDFYHRFPDWSIHGKDIWDNARAIDYLQSLDFVDPEKIGMTGHSYGGHSTVFAAALEPRIKVAVANGPVSDFLHHGMHWAVPKGGGNSQSLPAMRPYVLDHTLPVPITFYELTALIAPRPLLVGQAVGERRPMEEENYAAVRAVYQALGCADRVRYHWYAGDHDYPPVARKAAVEWFQRWFSDPAMGGSK